jgi:type I restriction enzyme R subunit
MGHGIREELGQPKETVWLIDWKIQNVNDFAIAEEVTVQACKTTRYCYVCKWYCTWSY